MQIPSSYTRKNKLLGFDKIIEPKHNPKETNFVVCLIEDKELPVPTIELSALEHLNKTESFVCGPDHDDGHGWLYFNSTDKEMMGIVYASKALLGQDDYCMEYLGAHRKVLYGKDK